MENISEAILTVKIENVKPIEVTDFTDSFNSLAEEYYKFLSESEHFKLHHDTKLYIKEVKSGSIITELTDLVPLALPFIEHTNSIIDFSKFLKQGFEYFLGKTNEKPKDFDLKDCNNFSNIIKPIAKDNGSNVFFTGHTIVKAEKVVFNYNSVEANAIQNGILREKDTLKEPLRNIEKGVLFYWDSAKNDEKSKAIDRGFIDALNANSLKVTFENPDIKKEMLLEMENNPFHCYYLVDVEVLTVKNIPTVYKIIKLHEILSK